MLYDFSKQSFAKNYTSTCCIPIKFPEISGSSVLFRYALMSSFVLSISWSMVFPWVWHPGSPTTSETYHPSSSFSMITVNFFGIFLKFSRSFRDQSLFGACRQLARNHSTTFSSPVGYLFSIIPPFLCQYFTKHTLRNTKFTNYKTHVFPLS